MTTIDEIMVAAYAHSAATASGRSVCPRLAAAELRSIITQAIAEARADGAREMREAAASAGFDAAASDENACEVMDAIEALPLPAGTVNVVMDREHGGLTFGPDKREPVRLTDVDVIREICLAGMKMQTPDGAKQLCRAIETAVLAANGLTK